MNFIEVLKSVGGVKPCPKCGAFPFSTYMSCETCHGTGSILDLAPLLAKPKELQAPVFELIAELVTVMYPDLVSKGKEADFPGGKTRYRCFDQFHKVHGKHLCAIGPQRAHSLIYEVARQLGGTAVMATTNPTDTRCTHCGHAHLYAPTGEQRSGSITCKHRKQYNHDPKRGPSDSFDEFSLPCAEFIPRLSLPIPDNSTVLFVTDRLDEKEMTAVMDATMTSAPKSKPYKFLTYVLALVSDRVTWVFDDPEKSEWKVISLHQEK